METIPPPSSGNADSVEARSLPCLEVVVMSIFYCFCSGTDADIFVLTTSSVSL